MNLLKEYKISRGKFLTLSGITVSGLLMGIDGGLPETDKKQSYDKTHLKVNKLTGKNLKELLKEYRYYLFDDYLPFLDKYVIDHKYGGFMCNTDRDGKNIDQNKSVVYEGRGIWVYSFLYNNIKKDPKYLEVAEKSVKFLLMNEPSDNSLWPSYFSREGKVLKGTEDIYGDLSVATGLSEYSKATGEEKYWRKAKQILLKCMSLYNNSDYDYKVTYGPKAEHNRGVRVLGHWMVILNLVSQMLEQRKDYELERIANNSVDAIMKYHFNPEYELVSEVLNHDLSRPKGPFSQFVYTGHVIETFGIMLFEAIRKNDKKLFNLTAERFKRHFTVAKDDVYGGLFRCLINVDENIWEVDKVLWLQEESLIASMSIFEHTGALWAKDIFEEMWKYVIDKYPLKQYGYSLWILGADRKVTFKKHYARVGNFHHPRHLMLNILAIQRMINNNK